MCCHIGRLEYTFKQTIITKVNNGYRLNTHGQLLHHIGACRILSRHSESACSICGKAWLLITACSWWCVETKNLLTKLCWWAIPYPEVFEVSDARYKRSNR